MDVAVRIGIIASGVFLWIGMLAGVWKYLQIRQSPRNRAHYYVDITHRAALMYASASLVLAVLAYYSAWSVKVNTLMVLGNIIFFSAAILSYIVHGVLQDTSNQLQQPHQVGKMQLPSVLMTGFMWTLIIAEVGGTTVLLLGAIKTLML